MDPRQVQTALRRRSVRVALNGLVGLPPGGWGETVQALTRIAEELPRGVRACDVVDAALAIDSATGRYRWRDDV